MPFVVVSSLSFLDFLITLIFWLIILDIRNIGNLLRPDAHSPAVGLSPTQRSTMPPPTDHSFVTLRSDKRVTPLALTLAPISGVFFSFPITPLNPLAPSGLLPTVERNWSNGP